MKTEPWESPFSSSELILQVSSGFFFERLPYVKKNPVCLPISLVVVKPPSCVFSFKDCK